MPSRLRLAPFLLLCLCLASCRSMHGGSANRTIEGPYTQVFVATSMFLLDRGFPLQTVDRANGRIVTGLRPGSRASTWERSVEKVTVRLRDRNGAVTVNLLLSFADQVSDPPPRTKRKEDDPQKIDVTSTLLSRTFDASVVYDDYLDAIQQRVDEMCDTP